jgi:signal transduction histidine kinase
VKWVLWGIATAMTPYVFLRVLPGLFGAARADSPVPPAVDRVLELAAPAAFAIAVARHRLFDIDVIIRRSVLDTTLALLLAGAAMGVVLLLERTLPRGAVPTEVVWLLAGAVPVALFAPLRRGLGRWVDRTFFKIRHVHGQSLRALEGPLARAADAAETAAVLRRFVEEALLPQAAAVVVLSEGEAVVDGSLPEGAARRAAALLAPFRPEDGIALACVGATTLPEIEVAGFPADLRSAGVVLVQPVSREGRVRALLLLGPKASERAYVEEDLTLLAAAAGRAVVSLERLALVQNVAREALARRALADLDRQKTDFLLRVAHDLRTPLTAVRWTVDNLLDGLSGPLTPRQSADLAPVRTAAGQLNRMIDNLLAISRLELGATRLACEPVDLAAVVREALTATAPQAAAKGVGVALAAHEGLACVRGRRDAVYEVALNLVDNAIKYSPPGGAVDVHLAPGGNGGAMLSVRDRGPGLGGADPASLFDLFRQGDASPHSTAKGFGVGLYVVRSWIETFGGSVGAADAPGGGAVFTCLLERWTDTGGSA